MEAIQQVNTVDTQKITAYLEATGLVQNMTKQQTQQFVEICQAFGLNPFKREIYASKYGDNFSIIVGYETYIKRAERSGRLSGWHVTTSGDQASGTLKAIITIHRKDWDHAFTHEVYYSEYVQKTKDGYPTKFWKDKPITMLKKVAISQGFRMCFSDELGGMPYTQDELGVETVDVQYKEEPKDDFTPKPGQLEVTHVDEPIAKRGRPKKDAEVIETARPSIEQVTTEIYLAQSIEELKTIYGRYVTYQKNEDFLKHLNTRKTQINLQAVKPTTDELAQQIKAGEDDSYESHMQQSNKF